MKKISAFIKRIDWTNSTFLITTPIIGITGTLIWLKTSGFNWPTFFLFLFMTFATGLAITAGYHRLFSHKAYDAAPLYKLFMLLFGAAAFENSALRWSSDHRNHHKYVDTDLDPYNIKRGFWYAHMGWVMLKYDKSHRYDNVADLEKDTLVMFQERHYVKLGIIVGLIFPTLLAALWGDWLGGLFFAGVFRTVMNQHFTFCINSFAHLIGTRPYSDQNTSRDNWFLAFLTYGEGYHNYHHKFPSDYRNGIRLYQWDPTKWLIKGLERSGQTYNLRRISNETILKAKLKMDEKRIFKKIESSPHLTQRISNEFVVSARLKIEEAYSHLLAMKTEYQSLKTAKVALINQRIAHLKAEIQKAKERLHEATHEWGYLCGQVGVPSTRLVFSS